MSFSSQKVDEFILQVNITQKAALWTLFVRFTGLCLKDIG
jgi:hypothetical protein